MSVARDIMTQDVLSVKMETPIIEAIDMLLKNKISGLPVVDDEMRVIGVVSEKDFLSILLDPDFILSSPIAQCATRKVIKFKDDEEVTKICSYFIDHNIRRVPIVKDDKLVGVISRRNILGLIHKTVLSFGKE